MLKKSITLSLSFILFSLLSTGFTVDTKKIDTDKLCKTWYITSGVMKSGDYEEQLPEDIVNGKMIFYKNFTVKFIDPIDKDEVEKGTWKDLNGKLYIDIDDDPMTFEVKTLTNNKLIISSNKDGVYASMTLSTSKKK